MINTKKLKASLDLILGFSVVLYVLGFVIVNSYFGSYGISPENITNARYLSAALLFLFSFSIFLYGAQIVKKDKDTKKDVIDIKSYSISAITIYLIWTQLFGIHAFQSHFFVRVIDTLLPTCGIIFLVIVPYFIYGRIRDKSNILVIFLPLFLFAFIFLTPEFTWFVFINFFIVRMIVRFLNKKGENDEASEKPPFGIALNVLAIILFLIADASIFGGIIYPLIPANLGGGKPALANLLIDDSYKMNIAGLGIKINADGWTNELKLLHKNQNSIYVESTQPERFSCVEIKGDIVKSIRFTGESRMTFWEIAKKAVEIEKNK